MKIVVTLRRREKEVGNGMGHVKRLMGADKVLFLDLRQNLLLIAALNYPFVLRDFSLSLFYFIVKG